MSTRVANINASELARNLRLACVDDQARLLKSSRPWIIRAEWTDIDNTGLSEAIMDASIAIHSMVSSEVMVNLLSVSVETGPDARRHRGHGGSHQLLGRFYSYLLPI